MITLPFFVVLGLYRAVLRYVGRHALITIGKAVTLAALVFWVVVLVLPVAAIQRGVARAERGRR